MKASDFDKYNLIVFGVDEVIRVSNTEAPVPNKSNEWTLLPGVREAFSNLRGIIEKRRDHDRGPLHVGFASNQGGIAFSILTSQKARSLIREAVIEGFDGEFPPFFIRICGSNDDSDYRRKPNPGMLEEIMHQASSMASATLVVGLEIDSLMAQKVGADFMTHESFFGRE